MFIRADVVTSHYAVCCVYVFLFVCFFDSLVVSEKKRKENLLFCSVKGREKNSWIHPPFSWESLQNVIGSSLAHAPPLHPTTKFQENQFICFCALLLTDRQTDRQRVLKTKPP